MRAAQLVSYEKDFQVNQVDDPTVTDPHDVIVGVRAAGFCRTDIHMWLGQFDAMQKGAGVDLPFTCGHETAGWVAEVGSGVTHVAVGDAVLLHPLATCGFCRVVDTSAAALDRATGWGADKTVQAKEDGSHLAEITDLTGGGAQVVLDYVGEGGAQNDAIGMLAANGVDFLVGYGGTLNVEILSQALFPETSFVGNICGTYNELVELVALARRGAVRLETTTFGLYGVNEALHALNEGRMIGRGVLVPTEN